MAGAKASMLTLLGRRDSPAAAGHAQRAPGLGSRLMAFLMPVIVLFNFVALLNVVDVVLKCVVPRA